jgi:hypothetical protein
MRSKNNLIHVITSFMLLVFVLTACKPVENSGSSNFAPTLNAITATATETLTSTPPVFPSPSETSAQDLAQQTPIIIEQPTKIPSMQPSVESIHLKTPAANLNITKPGPNSKLSSPILVNGYAYPGYENKVTIQLFGEDGRLMADQEITLQKSDSGWVSFSTQIPFTILTAGESASLMLVTYDAFGRRIAMCNIPLLLMQIGDSEIESAGFSYAPSYLVTPENASAVSGGTIHLEGYTHPYNTDPVIIDVINEKGTTIISQIVPIHPVGDANYMYFSADIPYSVSSATPVRLTIRQMMNHSPYLDLGLSSITLILKP